MDLSARSYFTAGIALTAATAIALTPVVVSPGNGHHVPVPYVSVAEIQLAAAINPADVVALVGNLNAAMGSVTSTVSSLVDGSGQTLAEALNSASGLNNSLWDGLIRAAGASPTLASVMIALKAASAGGLSQLAGSVAASGDTIALSSGQVAGVLTSTVTGSLGSALQAVTSIVNDPLSAASYLGLLTTPFGIAGMALEGGISAAAALGTGGVEVASTLVTGVTAQIGNALALVNGVLDAGKSLTDIALIDGTLTAVQGIVSAPVSAALAGVNGITGAVAKVAKFSLGAVAGGANGVVSTWLGDASSTGALAKALVAIGSAPLSPASYTEAIGVLVGAGFSTVKTVTGTVSSFASLPFRVGADLTNTGAAVITSFTYGLADVASGLLHAAGMSPLISGLPRVLATAVSGAVKVAAFTTAAALNTIATAIDFGQAVGGIFDARTSVLSAAAASPAALPTAGPGTALVSTSTDVGDAEVTAKAAASPGATKHASPTEEAVATTATTSASVDAEPVSTAAEPAAEATSPERTPSTAGATDVGDELPALAVKNSETGKADEQTTRSPAGSGAATSKVDDKAATGKAGGSGEASDTATDAPAKGATAPKVDREATTTGTGRHAASGTRSDGNTTDGSGSASYGRHASGATASESSTAGGRHRSGATASSGENAPSGSTGGSASQSTGGQRAAA
ncbi:hypothetical protein [Mycolicibacterium frederiksbergense]|uniref:hypothetical protein n=1 Tax=Mycolicibacterium frederiksbergense TaxID=117567 RepID=UPI001AE5D3CF|nr:hypothetical protein [Mycolicibacterium frederiksbergense]